MFCKECGQAVPGDAYVCPSCGAKQKDFKYCKHCAAMIDTDCIICPKCGKQVEELKAQSPNIVINNANNNVNTNVNNNNNAGPGRRAKNKWAALCLCLFLGCFGGHKFYEGKIGGGILYLFTAGLFGIGVIVDLIRYLFKPNPYYV